MKRNRLESSLSRKIAFKFEEKMKNLEEYEEEEERWEEEDGILILTI